jgi:hypothetical protein
MIRFRALLSTLLVLVGVAGVSAQQVVPHKVFPLKPIPSEQWIEVLSGDPSKAGVPFVLGIHNDAGYVCTAHSPHRREHRGRSGNLGSRHGSAHCLINGGAS